MSGHCKEMLGQIILCSALMFVYRSVQYGALGMVLGHELTHGFDNNGEHFTSYPCILQQLSKLPTELTRGFENIGIALVVEFSHAVI